MFAALGCAPSIPFCSLPFATFALSWLCLFTISSLSACLKNNVVVDSVSDLLIISQNKISSWNIDGYLSGDST